METKINGAGKRSSRETAGEGRREKGQAQGKRDGGQERVTLEQDDDWRIEDRGTSHPAAQEDSPMAIPVPSPDPVWSAELPAKTQQHIPPVSLGHPLPSVQQASEGTGQPGAHQQYLGLWIGPGQV